MTVNITDAMAYLNAPSADAETVERLIQAAVSMMESEGGRHFEDATVTEKVNVSRPSDSLYLREPPREIVSVSPDENLTYSIIGCRLRAERNYWYGWYDVTYKAGFETLPPDLYQAVLEQTAALYSQWQIARRGMDQLSATSVDGWSQSFRERVRLEAGVAQTVRAYLEGL